MAIYKERNDEVSVVYLKDGKVVEEKFPNPYLFVAGISKSSLMNLDFVVDVENIDLKGRDRKGNEYELLKVVVDRPKSVILAREYVEKEGGIHFEADIPYVRRLMIDNQIDFDWNDNDIVYFDIEVDDSKGFPKEYGNYKILSIGVYDVNGEYEFFNSIENNERDMLIDFIEWIKRRKKRILCAWNIEFDYGHIKERLKYFGLWDEYKYFSLMQKVDLLEEYKAVVKGLTSYSLEEVSIYEGFEIPKHRDVLVSSMSLDELEKYNMYDVELIYKIDRKYAFAGTKMSLANFISHDLDLSALKIGDCVIIRRLRELGYVACSGRKDVKVRDYEGALVLEPKKGMFEYVLYADVNALYPNVIIYKKIDIDGWNGEVVPEIEKVMLEKRNEYKRLYKETGKIEYNLRQLTMKIIANSLYGLFGLKSFRYYNPDKAEMVTRGGREVLLKMKEYLENKLNIEVLYGDSVAKDSKIMIRKSGKIECIKIEDLFDGNPDYIEPICGKEYRFLDDVETLTLDENGNLIWKKVKYVMRHKVNKRMFRIWVNDDVYVDVTEDHSLILRKRSNGVVDEVSPIEILENIDDFELIVYEDGVLHFVNDFKILEIEYDDYVYDVEVEKTHRFFANGILVHNTDSEFINLKALFDKNDVDKDDVMNIAEWITDLINMEIHPFAVKVEDVFRRIIFLAKKRYIGITMDGEIVYKGIELRRSDYCELAKEVLNNVIRMLLIEGKDVKSVKKYMSDVKMKLFSGEYDEKLIIAKSITKDIGEYKVLPPHIRAYKKVLEMGYDFVDFRVRYVFVKDRNDDVYPIIKNSDLKKVRIDYNRYWETQIYPPVERILNVLNDNVSKLDKWFG